MSRGSGWVVDHDHETGDVRGVLCNPCNIILGKAKDNPDILKNAANYLTEHSQAPQRQA